MHSDWHTGSCCRTDQAASWSVSIVLFMFVWYSGVVSVVGVGVRVGWPYPWSQLRPAACILLCHCMCRKLKVFDWLGLPAATAWGWVLQPSAGYVGQGMIMGPKTAWSMMAGAITGVLTSFKAAISILPLSLLLSLILGSWAFHAMQPPASPWLCQHMPTSRCCCHTLDEVYAYTLGSNLGTGGHLQHQGKQKPGIL